MLVRLSGGAITLFAGLMVLSAGCLAEEDEIVGEQTLALTSVTWTNVVGVDASGDDLTKSVGPVGWNAGASSVESISADGALEFTTGETNTGKTVGLNGSDTSASFTDIDFAIRLTDTSRIRVYENGVDRGPFGPYAAGDLFRIDVNGGVVNYLRNGAVFYTSTLTASFPLFADASLNHVGATVQNVQIGESFWQNTVGVNATGNDLTKTGALQGWNAGASTIQSISGNGFVEFTTSETNRGKMGGLSNGDSNVNFTDIDYAVSLSATGVVRVYEKGTSRGQFGTYVAGDVFRVAVNGNVVTYAKNGAVFYTSAVAPVFPLLFDSSFNTPGGTIRDVTFGETFWQNTASVDVSGNDLTKVGTTGWNAGASTTATITGTGNAEFTTGDTTKAKMAGLSVGDATTDYVEIDFAINLTTTGLLKVYENGVFKGSFGSYSAGDLFRIEVGAGGVVTYARNGVVFYTSANTPAGTLLFDVSMSHAGATIQDVVVTDTPDA